MSWRLPTLTTVLLSLTMILGCDQGKEEEEPTSKVTGTVTLDGKPVAKGMIKFEGDDDSAKGLAPASAEIKGGQYEAVVRAGSKTVRINAPVETGKADETGVKPTKETIPAKYNEKSTLKKTISVDGPNTLNFDLKSK